MRFVRKVCSQGKLLSGKFWAFVPLISGISSVEEYIKCTVSTSYVTLGTSYVSAGTSNVSAGTSYVTAGTSNVTAGTSNVADRYFPRTS